jgi:hypothetical protein
MHAPSLRHARTDRHGRRPVDAAPTCTVDVQRAHCHKRTVRLAGHARRCVHAVCNMLTSGPAARQAGRGLGRGPRVAGPRAGGLGTLGPDGGGHSAKTPSTAAAVACCRCPLRCRFNGLPAPAPAAAAAALPASYSAWRDRFNAPAATAHAAAAG